MPHTHRLINTILNTKIAKILDRSIADKTIANNILTILRLPTLFLVVVLMFSQVGGSTFNLLAPALQQKLVLNNLLQSLGLDSNLKALAATSSSSSTSSTLGVSSAVSSTASAAITSSTVSSDVVSSSSNSQSVSSGSSITINTSSKSGLSSSNSLNSSSLNSSSTSSGINPTAAVINFGNGQTLNVAVQCVDSADDGTFSLVIGYNSTAPRKEITSGALVPNRPVIHTHFDRLDKDTLDYNDPNINTKLSGPITYFKGVSGTATTVADQKAMIIQGQGTETVFWNFTVDGIAYKVGANKEYATKCEKPKIKTISPSDNIIPPVDNKYIVFEYSNIFNTYSTFFLATENESREAGAQIKFYSTATREKNKDTGLWYYDTITKQIKSKVDGMCVKVNHALASGQDSVLTLDVCQKTLPAIQNQLFENKPDANGKNTIQYKVDTIEYCLIPNLQWHPYFINTKSTLSDNTPLMGNPTCNPYNFASYPRDFNWVVNNSSNPTIALEQYNKFQLTKVDCMENAKAIFGTYGDVRAAAIGQNGEALSVRISVKNFDQNSNNNTNVAFGISSSSISNSSKSSVSSATNSSISLSSFINKTTDRILDCKDVEQMQTADLTTLENKLDTTQKSLYGYINLGANVIDTIDLSGLENSIVVMTVGKKLTKKGQNWFFDLETNQIKSAFDGMCLSPVTYLSQQKVGIKKCDLTGNDINQKWNVLTNFNNQGFTRLQNLANNKCVHGEYTWVSTNGLTLPQDIQYDGRMLDLIDCQNQNGFYEIDKTDVVIDSKIDPRDANLLGLENYRLQKLYNGSTPAKDTPNFEEMSLVSNPTSKLGLLVGPADPNNIQEFLDRKAGYYNLENVTGNSESRKTKWKYNSTTKQIYSEFQDICLELFAMDNGGDDQIRGYKCNSLSNKQKWNVMKMTNNNFMIQNVFAKKCLDTGSYGKLYLKEASCGQGLWQGGIGNYSTSFPILKTSIPLINILSNTTTNGKKWTLDVKAGNIGANSELFVWEGVTGNTNQMFAYNPETSEIYYNPSRQTEVTGQKVIIQDPAFPNDVTKKIEVPVFVKNFAEAMTCLDAVEGAKGARIKVNPCNGKLGQKWSFSNLTTTTTVNGVNTIKIDINKPIIKNIAQNFCIDAEGSWNNPLDQMYNGRNAVIWDCTGTANQQFVKYEKGELLAKIKSELANQSIIANLSQFLNQVTAAAQSIVENITNGTSTINTINSPCYTDKVSDNLVCNIARSQDPILDPLEKLLDSVDTRDVSQVTKEEAETVAKATEISKKIDTKLEAQNNAKDTVNEAALLENALDIIKDQASVISTIESQTADVKSPNAIENLLKKAPTSDEYQKIHPETKSSNSEVTGYLDSLNPFKDVKASAANPSYVGSYYISLFGKSNYVMELTTALNYGDQTQVVMWDKVARNSQKWNIENDKIKSLGDRCLDAGDNRRGSWARINECHGGSNQSWTVYQNYTIKNNGSGLCLGLGQSGSGNITLGNGAPLIMVNCEPDNCTTYFSSDQVTGYNLANVNSQCVRDVGLTPVTPPPPAPTTWNPNPTPYYDPVWNGGGGNNTPSGGTGNLIPPSVNNTSTTSTTDEDIDDDTEYNNFLNSEYEVNVNINQTNIYSDLWTAYSNGAAEAWDMTKDLNSYCFWSFGIGCETGFWAAFSNLIGFIAHFLWGVFKGLAAFIVDSVKAIIDIIKGIPNIVDTIGATFQSLSKLFTQNNLANVFIKAGENSSNSVYDHIRDYTNKNIWQKFEHVGYWVAYITVSVWTIYKSITSLVAAIPRLINYTINGIKLVPTFNIAKSLVNARNYLKVGDLWMKVRTYGNSIKVTGAEIVRLIREGNLERLKNYVIGNDSKLSAYFKLANIYSCEAWELKNVMKHWLKHRFEFNNFVIDDYVNLIKKYKTIKISENSILVKIDSSAGRRRVYNTITNEFSIFTANNEFITLYKPKQGLNYFNTQPGNLI